MINESKFLHGEKLSRFEQVSLMTSVNKNNLDLLADAGQSLRFPLLFYSFLDISAVRISSGDTRECTGSMHLAEQWASE